jgi:hypothetical protein
LNDAIARALEVPGATPQRVFQLMVRRQQGMRRELASARDPVAVLVWAASDYAVRVLRDEAGQRAGDAESRAERRLHVLDAALVRQQDNRAARAAHEDRGVWIDLLGPPPTTPAGADAWRRAVRTGLDYRDRVGLSDRDVEHRDPFVRALGPLPDDERLRVSYRDVRAAVVDARVDIALAELARFVPELPARTAPTAPTTGRLLEARDLLTAPPAWLRREVRGAAEHGLPEAASIAAKCVRIAGTSEQLTLEETDTTLLHREPAVDLGVDRDRSVSL